MVPARPFFIGRPGWVRSSAWICDFSSIDSTTAWAGGSTYKPTISASFSGGQVTDCDVLNISAGGALIRCEQGLPIDGPFEITIADYPPLTAQIVRTHQDNHGIAFDGDAKEIANLVDEILLDAPHHRDKRSFPRRLVLLAASFYLGDEFVKCKVQNISAGGFFAKSDKCPEAGTTIEFNLARFGTMPVRVIWANEKGMGGVFLETSAQIIQRIGHLLPGVPDAKPAR